MSHRGLTGWLFSNFFCQISSDVVAVANRLSSIRALRSINSTTSFQRLPPISPGYISATSFMAATPNDATQQHGLKFFSNLILNMWLCCSSRRPWTLQPNKLRYHRNSESQKVKIANDFDFTAHARLSLGECFSGSEWNTVVFSLLHFEIIQFSIPTMQSPYDEAQNQSLCWTDLTLCKLQWCPKSIPFLRSNYFVNN